MVLAHQVLRIACGVTMLPAAFQVKRPSLERTSSPLPRYLKSVMKVPSDFRMTTVSIPRQSAQGMMPRHAPAQSSEFCEVLRAEYDSLRLRRRGTSARQQG
jgi:hypothetical protein